MTSQAPVPDVAGAAAAPPPEETSDAVTWKWTIANYRSIREDKIYGDVFKTAKHKWRVLCFPRGNGGDSFSLFLDGGAESATLPANWSVYCQFTLSVINHVDPEKTIRREAHHRFCRDEADWGFTNFMKLSALKEPHGGYLVNDKISVECDVEVLNDEEDTTNWWNYDSKKETGFVGLKNQGATCYMNSLLQTLHHTPAFRKAVYLLPTQNDQPEKSISLALQRVFYRLQYDDAGVGTKELTKSFGWDTIDSFMQHDVQELNRVLSDNLERKMKGTVVEGTIGKLFKGNMKNYIRCINVEYESSRVEEFYDISLNVKGMKNIYEAFDNYVKPELMNGPNQYRAEGFGLQDANMGVVFQNFPPVLHIQLKRFEYDFQRDTNVKINDRFEFPTVLELDRYLSPDADRTNANTYDLHGVLVHSGDVHGGHYYAFIKPAGRSDWYKFDDDRVTRAPEKSAVQENFGFSEEKKDGVTNGRWPMGRSIRMSKRFTNAYMLVYVRRCDKDWSMADVQDDEVPSHLRERLEQEKAEEEERRKEKQEAHLFIRIKVAREEDFRAHDNSDLVDFKRVDDFKVAKTATLVDFQRTIEEKYGVSPQRQRFWKWVNRVNKTCRPEQLVPLNKYRDPIVNLFKVPNDCKLFLEVSPVPDSNDPATKYFENVDANDDAMIYFKVYDPRSGSGTLRYVGKMACRKTWKYENLVPLLNKLNGWDAAKPISIVEEIRPTMIEPLKPELTLREAELQNGDILCFQEKIDEVLDVPHPDVRAFFNYLLNRVVVLFRQLDKPREGGITLELLKNMTHDDVCQQLGTALKVDGEKIRLTGHNSYGDTPKQYPMKRTNQLTGGLLNLTEMLFNYQPAAQDTLYYEVLDMTLKELESKVKLQVAWYNARSEYVSSHTMLVSKKGTVKDLLDDFRVVISKSSTEVETLLANPEVQLRLMEVSFHRIVKVFSPRDPVNLINEQSHLRIEAIPNEELQLQSGDRLLYCAHFHDDVYKCFGNPFVLLIKNDEGFAATKARIQEKLAVSNEEISKWKFAIVTFSRPEYLTDASVLSRRDFWHQDFIGLDHVDTTPPSQRQPQTTHTYHHQERSIKIYN